ncbi:MAG TPA: hypothetical protein GX528_01540 [Firmicutes bacterium]|nr:hypothetical protein [Bacillota bacterium]
MKYLPWGLVVVLAGVLAWSLLAAPLAGAIGTVNMARVVDESARAGELNDLLSERYNELIAEFNLEEEAEEDDASDRGERERRAYAQYLAFRQELEVKFQEEVDRSVQKVAQNRKLKVVIDNDVVRYGGEDLTDEVIKQLK